MMVLVTGASGFLGRRLTEMLLAKGETVRLALRQASMLDPALADTAARSFPPSNNVIVSVPMILNIICGDHEDRTFTDAANKLFP